MKIKKTVQMEVVLDTVRKMGHHATADEIYSEINKIHPSISRGTVYRNLNRLSELQEISRRELPGGASCYDCRCENHYHARCSRCGRVYDVDMDYIPDLFERISDTRGFIFLQNDIVFKCICPECQEK